MAMDGELHINSLRTIAREGEGEEKRARERENEREGEVDKERYW